MKIESSLNGENVNGATENQEQTSIRDSAELAPAASDGERTATRRRLFSLGLPAAAAFLAACGKTRVAGGSRKLNKDTDLDDDDANGVNASRNNGNGTGDDPNGDGSGRNGNSSGDGTQPGGDGLGGDGVLGNPNDNTNGGGGNGTDSGDGDGTMGGGMGTGPMPCDGIGIDVINTINIMDSPDLIALIDAAPAVKIWGRSKSAMVVLAMNPALPIGTSVMIAAPTDNPNLKRVLAARTILNSEVDLTGNFATISVDSLNLSGLTKLVVIVVEPDGTSSKQEISSGVSPASATSGRYATTFDGKPVYDAQVAFLASEGTPDLDNRMTEYMQKFPTGSAGFSFNRDTADALQAVNVRTDGYLTAGVQETAHIATAQTTWGFPSALSSARVCDLLERDVSAMFSGSETTALKDDYTFVVYIPSSDEKIYFRYIVGVG